MADRHIECLVLYLLPWLPAPSYQKGRREPVDFHLERVGRSKTSMLGITATLTQDLYLTHKYSSLILTTVKLILLQGLTLHS